MRYGHSFLFQLVVAVLVPVTIGLFFPGILDAFWAIMWWVLLYLPFVLLISMIYEWSRGESGILGTLFKYFSVVPGGMVYGSDLKNRVIPWTVLSLVAVNTVTFVTVPEDVVLKFIFFPVGASTAAQDLTSFFKVLARKDFPEAVKLVTEHFPNHLNEMDGDVLFRLGAHFQGNVDLNKARPCLELASGKSGNWQPKALLLLSRTFEALGNPARAAMALKHLLELDAEVVFRQEAMNRLAEIEEEAHRLDKAAQLN